MLTTIENRAAMKEVQESQLDLRTTTTRSKSNTRQTNNHHRQAYAAPPPPPSDTTSLFFSKLNANAAACGKVVAGSAAVGVHNKCPSLASVNSCYLNIDETTDSSDEDEEEYENDGGDENNDDEDDEENNEVFVSNEKTSHKLGHLQVNR